MTLQVKCLSRGERTAAHTDDLNCRWQGYRKTSAACWTIVDAMRDVWSFKVVTNSRTRLGCSFDKHMQMDGILNRIKRLMDLLTHAYEILAVQYRGRGKPYPKLTAKTFQGLVLDEDCPWEEVEIHDGIKMWRMKFPAVFVRDIFLSAPSTIMFRHHRGCRDHKKTLRLAVFAGYQSGFHKMFYLGHKYMDELVAAEDPALVYYQKAMEEFGKLTGDPIVGRIVPPGLDFRKVFIEKGPDGEDRMNGVMTELVDGIEKLLVWINDNVGTDNFNHATIEARFRETVKDFQGLGAEMAEFRLMMVVQVCVLSGIVVKGHKDLHNLVYPVATLGAARQLNHIHPSERPRVVERIKHEFGFDPFGNNAVEGSLCESSIERVTTIFDVVFMYQHLFTLSPEGDQQIKMWGSWEWEKL